MADFLGAIGSGTGILLAAGYPFFASAIRCAVRCPSLLSWQLEESWKELFVGSLQNAQREAIEACRHGFGVLYAPC